MADLLVEKYQGIRPAVGYPSLPDQSVNFLLDELLFAHPVSEYFSVGKIGEDQLEDYARRRRRSIEEMRKFLAANLQ